MTETAKIHNGHLTSGRLLARNTVWNLIGNGAPMLVAVFSIPILIHELGKDRFGVLALAWALIGYASLFDIGLGRALTQLVAKKLGCGEDHEIPALAWTSLLLMVALGVVGAVFIIVIAPWLVHHALKIPEGLQSESLRAFYLLGLSVPAVISAAGLRGLLEAHQRFDLVSALRIPMGVFTFVGPLLVLPFSRSLLPVTGILVAGRFVGCLAHLWLCFRVVPELMRRVAWHSPSAGPLLRFGGWMTISNTVSPLMVTLDRFLIAGLVSLAAVAYYATPFEIVTKLILIPGSFVGVMFPAFAATFVQDRTRTALLYTRCVKYLFLVLFPIFLLIVSFSQDGLELWLGAEFAQHSYRVLQWLAVGVFMNCLAQVPFALLQGVGKPDLTAKMHLAELPCYLLALWWLISAYGIVGAAMAWTCRNTIDALVLFGMTERLFPRSAAVRRVFALLIAIAFLVLGSVIVSQVLLIKGLFLLSAIGGFVLVGWFRVLSAEERTLAMSIFSNQGIVS